MTPEWRFNKTAVCVEQRHTAGAGEHCCRAAAGSLAFTNDTFLSMHVNPPLHPHPQNHCTSIHPQPQLRHRGPNVRHFLQMRMIEDGGCHGPLSSLEYFGKVQEHGYEVLTYSSRQFAMSIYNLMIILIV